MSKLKNKFIEASKCNDLETVKEYIKQGVNVNVKSNHNYTILMYCSFNGYLEMVKLLVENGADVNAKSNIGYTALGESLKLNNKLNNFDIFNYLTSFVYDYKQFEKIYNKLKIEQKHVLFKHFMNNIELLKQVNPLRMKGFVKDINKYKKVNKI